jgi:hypothetical protein
MQEYEEVRHSIIDMLEDLDDRLANITHNVKDPLTNDVEEQSTQTENPEDQDDLDTVASPGWVKLTTIQPQQKD